MWKLLLALLIYAPIAEFTYAEEEFNLDDIKESSSPKYLKGLSNSVKLFGRVDLTSEFTPYDPDQVTTNNQFKTQHFLVFLNAKPDKNITFQSEIIDQSFYFVDYKISENWKAEFGKIMVPFGETDHYHHLYGGNVNLAGAGIMFPNIWAEKGVNFSYSARAHVFDFYWVSGFTQLDASQEPVTNIPSNDTLQAGGFRQTNEALGPFRYRLSYYFTEWRPNSPLHAFGLDLKYTQPLQGRVLQNIDLMAGAAVIDIQQTDTENFKKQGDFFQVSLGFPDKHKMRIRYGTYDNDDRVSDVKDLKTWSLAWLKRMRVMQLMLEHQWNIESKNEQDNDILRFMASVNF